MTEARPLDPTQRYEKTPRPFSFVRPRLHRDSSEWLMKQLDDIRADAFEDIEKYRTEGKPEDDPDMREAIQDANYAIQIGKTVQQAYIDMLGPRQFTDNG
jgi:hypothetical protein